MAMARTSIWHFITDLDQSKTEPYVLMPSTSATEVKPEPGRDEALEKEKRMKSLSKFSSLLLKKRPPDRVPNQQLKKLGSCILNVLSRPMSASPAAASQNASETMPLLDPYWVQSSATSRVSGDENTCLDLSTTSARLKGESPVAGSSLSPAVETVNTTSEVEARTFSPHIPPSSSVLEHESSLHAKKSRSNSKPLLSYADLLTTCVDDSGLQPKLTKNEDVLIINASVVSQDVPEVFDVDEDSRNSDNVSDFHGESTDPSLAASPQFIAVENSTSEHIEENSADVDGEADGNPHLCIADVYSLHDVRSDSWNDVVPGPEIKEELVLGPQIKEEPPDEESGPVVTIRQSALSRGKVLLKITTTFRRLATDVRPSSAIQERILAPNVSATISSNCPSEVLTARTIIKQEVNVDENTSSALESSSDQGMSGYCPETPLSSESSEDVNNCPAPYVALDSVTVADLQKAINVKANSIPYAAWEFGVSEQRKTEETKVQGPAGRDNSPSLDLSITSLGTPSQPESVNQHSKHFPGVENSLNAYFQDPHTTAADTMYGDVHEKTITQVLNTCTSTTYAETSSKSSSTPYTEVTMTSSVSSSHDNRSKLTASITTQSVENFNRIGAHLCKDKQFQVSNDTRSPTLSAAATSFPSSASVTTPTFCSPGNQNARMRTFPTKNSNIDKVQSHSYSSSSRVPNDKRFVTTTVGTMPAPNRILPTSQLRHHSMEQVPGNQRQVTTSSAQGLVTSVGSEQMSSQRTPVADKYAGARVWQGNVIGNESVISLPPKSVTPLLFTRKDSVYHVSRKVTNNAATPSAESSSNFIPHSALMTSTARRNEPNANLRQINVAYFKEYLRSKSINKPEYIKYLWEFFKQSQNSHSTSVPVNTTVSGHEYGQRGGAVTGHAFPGGDDSNVRDGRSFNYNTSPIALASQTSLPCGQPVTTAATIPAMPPSGPYGQVYGTVPVAAAITKSSTVPSIESYPRHGNTLNSQPYSQSNSVREPLQQFRHTNENILHTTSATVTTNSSVTLSAPSLLRQQTNPPASQLAVDSRRLLDVHNSQHTVPPNSYNQPKVSSTSQIGQPLAHLRTQESPNIAYSERSSHSTSVPCGPLPNTSSVGSCSQQPISHPLQSNSIIQKHLLHNDTRRREDVVAPPDIVHPNLSSGVSESAGSKTMQSQIFSSRTKVPEPSKESPSSMSDSRGYCESHNTIATTVANNISVASGMEMKSKRPNAQMQSTEGAMDGQRPAADKPSQLLYQKACVKEHIAGSEKAGETELTNNHQDSSAVPHATSLPMTANRTVPLPSPATKVQQLLQTPPLTQGVAIALPTSSAGVATKQAVNSKSPSSHGDADKFLQGSKVLTTSCSTDDGCGTNSSDASVSEKQTSGCEKPVEVMESLLVCVSCKETYLELDAFNNHMVKFHGQTLAQRKMMCDRVLATDVPPPSAERVSRSASNTASPPSDGIISDVASTSCVTGVGKSSDTLSASMNSSDTLSASVNSSDTLTASDVFDTQNVDSDDDDDLKSYLY